MAKKSKKNDAAPIKIKGVLFRIYSTKNGTWQAYYNFAGEKKTIHRKDRETLDLAIAEEADKLTGAHLGESTLSAFEWQEYLRAKAILEPLKAGLVDAARHYERTFSGLKRKVTLLLAVEQFKTAKEDRGISDDYKDFIRTRLQWLTANLGDRYVSEISYDEIKAFMKKHGTKGRPYNNLRGLLVTFWRWCQTEGYYPKNEEIPPAKIETKNEFDEEASVYSPEQLTALLDKMPDASRHKDWVMLGAFFGLRVAEVLRLEGSDIHIEHKVIEVKAARAGKRIAKTGQRRLVPIPDNLLEYAKGLSKRKVKWGVFVQKHVRDAAKLAHGAWHKNVLRHSWISYKYAEIGNIAQVAAWAGTSADKIEKNYRALRTIDNLPVTKELAAKWFAIP